MKILLYLLVVILGIETYLLYSTNQEKAVVNNALRIANETQSKAYDSGILAYIVYANMLTNISEELSKNPVQAEKISIEYICSVLPLGEKYIENYLTKPEQLESLKVILKKNETRCKKP